MASLEDTIAAATKGFQSSRLQLPVVDSAEQAARNLRADQGIAALYSRKMSGAGKVVLDSWRAAAASAGIKVKEPR